MEGKYSGYKIAQTAWFVVSVYLGLVIADLTKDGLFQVIVAPPQEGRGILWVIVPTLIFCILTTIESYAWLNPPEDQRVSGQDAWFRFIHLIFYLLAILFQAFLAYACTSSDLQGNEHFFWWARSFGSVLVLYAMYNVVWIVKRWRFDQTGCPKYEESVRCTLFYGGFAAIFLFSESICAQLGIVHPGPLMCGIWFVYMSLYFTLWWRVWHSQAFRADANDLYGTVRKTATPSDR